MQRLLGERAGDARRILRRLVSQRRPRADRRGRLPAHRRPAQGRHHRRRLERLPQRPGDRARRLRRDPRSGGGRQARRTARRGAGRLRRAHPRPHAHHRAGDRPLREPTGPLQAPARGDIPRDAAPQLARQGRPTPPTRDRRNSGSLSTASAREARADDLRATRSFADAQIDGVSHAPRGPTTAKPAVSTS